VSSYLVRRPRDRAVKACPLLFLSTSTKILNSRQLFPSFPDPQARDGRLPLLSPLLVSAPPRMTTSTASFPFSLPPLLQIASSADRRRALVSLFPLFFLRKGCEPAPAPPPPLADHSIARVRPPAFFPQHFAFLDEDDILIAVIFLSWRFLSLSAVGQMLLPGPPPFFLKTPAKAKHSPTFPLPTPPAGSCKYQAGSPFSPAFFFFFFFPLRGQVLADEKK